MGTINRVVLVGNLTRTVCLRCCAETIGVVLPEPDKGGRPAGAASSA